MTWVMKVKLTSTPVLDIKSYKVKQDDSENIRGWTNNAERLLTTCKKSLQNNNPYVRSTTQKY
jgi:hypothetical protein